MGIGRGTSPAGGQTYGRRALAVAAVVGLATGPGVLVPAGAAPTPTPGTSTASAPPQGRVAPGSPDGRGAELYLRSCASCHGVRGQGTQRGPSLVGVGPASVDFQVGTGRMPLTAVAQQPPHRRPVFSAADIQALVAQVASFGAGGPQIPQVAPGDLRTGRELFLDNCAACHSATGAGAALTNAWIAPALDRATPVQVAEAVRVGPGLMPAFPDSVLTNQQVNALVSYVQELRSERVRPGRDLAGAARSIQRRAAGLGHRDAPAGTRHPVAGKQGGRLNQTEETHRRERSAARRISAAFGISALGAAGFATVYAAGGQTQLEGVALAVAFAGFAFGLGTWSRRLLPSGGYVEEHEPFDSPPAERRLAAAAVSGPESPLRRRGLVSALGLALGTLGVAALFPLRSLAPAGSRPGHALRTTPWAAGVRLVRADGSPVRPDEVPIDTVLGVFPEGHLDSGDAPAFAVRLDPARFTTPPPGGAVAGIVVYSLLCTHAGCPVKLYLKGTGRVLCPCHQSNFDLLAGARPIAGPAARASAGPADRHRRCGLPGRDR